MTAAIRQAGYAIKIGAAAALVALGDVLFFGFEPGASIGLFALAWVVALAAARPAIRRSPAARIALAAAAGFAALQVDDPSLLGWLLFWTALALAALLPRRRFDDALAWALRVAVHAGVGLVAPLVDLLRLIRVRKARRAPDRGLRAFLAVVTLPVVGGAVFVALFASANPLIGNVFARIALPDIDRAVAHGVLCAAILVTIWSSFRPTRFATGWRGGTLPMRFVDLPLATLVLSLVTFNLIFAGQNTLDIVFLWSGAALPGSVTMADYAHRGAYALIATALLAGLFVLVALRPGSRGAASPAVRRLVSLWIVQNLLLVASSILRTLDYIQAYSLTVLRLSALAWMALVAVGLALIGWRLIAGRTTAWLVNANALAAAIVLAAASIVDLGATAAAWNVDQVLRHGRAGPPLDLCYLEALGDSALVPLARLEPRLHDPVLRDRVTALRDARQHRIMERQAEWRSWTWRNARRLAAVETSLGPTPPAPRAAPDGRRCGRIVPPPSPAAAPTPLTRAPQR